MSKDKDFSHKEFNLIKQQILPGFETGVYEAVPNYDRNEFKNDFKASRLEDLTHRDNRVNIRVSASDMAKLQKLALKKGIPFQSLLANVVHSFANGSLFTAADITDANTAKELELKEARQTGRLGNRIIPDDTPE